MISPDLLRRITNTLFLGVCAYLIILLGLSSVHAADPIEFTDSTGKPKAPESLTVGQVIAEAGLNGDRYKACAGDIFSLFQENQTKKMEQVAVDLVQDALQQYTSQAAAYLVCRAESYINNLCIYGNCKGGGVDCKKPIASDVTSFLKLNYKDRLKSAFLSSCMSLYALKFTGDTVDGMIQLYGPGGLPAYATDWITAVNVRPAQQAQRRTWALLTSTDICPYFREEALNYFGVPQSYRDTPPIVNAMGLRVDERPPFSLRAACTLPRDFDPTDRSEAAFMKNGGYSFLSALNEPQNNLEGFVAIAQEELSNQKVALVKATSDQLIAGGGFLPVYGNKSESCNADPDGNCITDGGIVLPPGAVRDERMADLTANYNKLLQPNGESSIAMTDMGARLQARLLGLANQPIPLKLELSPEDNAANFTPLPTPAPATDPNDPVCAGIDPRCTCVTSDPSAQNIASSVFSGAIARAMQTSPELFVAGTNQIAPGINYRLVLQAICASIPSGCIPHPSQDNIVVLSGGSGLTISFDVITSDGYVRTNGGTPIAQCEAGVQD